MKAFRIEANWFSH